MAVDLGRRDRLVPEYGLNHTERDAIHGQPRPAGVPGIVKAKAVVEPGQPHHALEDLRDALQFDQQPPVAYFVLRRRKQRRHTD